MAAALATLPWVEAGTISANGKKRQAKFTVKDRTRFNLDDVKRVLAPRYDYGVTLLTGPSQ